MKNQYCRFVVHEHKASRLHYDFRLEIGGVLKSWAIPKGPTLDPRDKRLAVMVPDHLLSYIDFEGIIPDGSYGAGPVVIWDNGTFIMLDTNDPVKAIEAGKMVFELKGKKLKGAFAIARMKGLPQGTGKEWLLMKKKDVFAQEGYKLESELTPARLNMLKERTPPCDTD